MSTGDNDFGRFCAGLLLAGWRRFQQALKRNGWIFGDDQPNLFRAALLALFRGLLCHLPSGEIIESAPAGIWTRTTARVTRVQGGPVYQFQHRGVRTKRGASALDVGAGGSLNAQPAPTSLGPSSAALNPSSSRSSFLFGFWFGKERRIFWRAVQVVTDGFWPNQIRDTSPPNFLAGLNRAINGGVGAVKAIRHVMDAIDKYRATGKVTAGLRDAVMAHVNPAYTEAALTPADVAGELIYRSYVAQRRLSPEVALERWSAIFENVEAMEQRYQAEQEQSWDERDVPSQAVR